MPIRHHRWYHAGALGAVGLFAACNALLDIDEVEFGDTASTGSGSGTASGTASGAGTATGSGTANGGAGGSSVELCSNGIDDDGDGDPDCADADCASFACIASAPLGWSGPVLAYVGDPATAPTCGAPWASVAELGDGLADLPATCNACSCTDPSGGTCGQSTLTIYDAPSGCTGTILSTYGPLSDGACQQASIGASNSARASRPTVPNQGTCASSGGGVASLPVTWTTAARLCGGTLGAGCDGDRVCAPAAQEPYLTVPCIYQNGDVACPEGYDDRHLQYAGVDDSRGCSPCSCGAAAGGTCSGTVRIHDNTGCTAQRVELQANGSSCLALTSAHGSIQFDSTTTTPSGGDCPVQGGTPTGTVSASQPTTLCCGEGPGGTGGAGGAGGVGGVGGAGGGAAGTGGRGGG